MVRRLALALLAACAAAQDAALLDALDRELEKASQMIAHSNDYALRGGGGGGGRLLEEEGTFSYSFTTEVPTYAPTRAPTTAMPSLAPSISPVPTAAPTKATMEFFVDLVFFFSGFTDTDEAVAVAEYICMDEAAERVMKNLTKDTFEPDAGSLGDELTASCVVLNSTSTAGPVNAAPIVFDCEISMYREDAQEPADGVERTSAEAAALLQETIETSVNGTNETFVSSLVTGLLNNPDSDCTDKLSLTRDELINATSRRRLLQLGGILDDVGSSSVADEVVVAFSTSNPTSAPTDIPTFEPTVTKAPAAATPAPTGQACQYDSDCPYGQECDVDSRRRSLLFGYSAGICRPISY